MWDWFLELHATRLSGFGVNPIPFAEIEASARLLDIHPELWEVRLLRRIDRAYIETRAEESNG